MPPAAVPAPPSAARTGPSEPQAGRRAPLLTAAGVAAATGVIALADPQANHVPLCPLLVTTGLDCPLCGGLRSVQALTRGDLVGAADHNLLFVASLPLLAGAWLLWFLRAGSGRPGRGTMPRWLVPMGFGVAVAFAVLRNIPALGWLDSR